ncbi:unnamed protein product [Heligmosomoides polygyrus]|uniref:CNNM transmembrane domain-containing protein n=1 Tax=Heligmosomoides polygyrus TaxID=6339 RepID=A0A3P7TA72_HELPZ|nr:unnamed protein product [Heligmosomoides polygyrus]
MALTNIMSLTFILGILATVLPKTEELPKIAIYVVINLSIMVAALLIVLLLPYLKRLPILASQSDDDIKGEKRKRIRGRTYATVNLGFFVLLENMESIDLDREVEKMLALENANDNRFATLQSQMSTLMEQVRALKKQAAEAVERLDQIPRDYDDSPANPTIIVLPLAFLRAVKDLEETDKAKVMVYTALDGLACQLNQCPITAAIMLVWPHVMPSSHHISHFMRALERHLQCGGTLDMYPPPYEERRSEAWKYVPKSWKS